MACCLEAVNVSGLWHSMWNAEPIPLFGFSFHISVPSYLTTTNDVGREKSKNHVYISIRSVIRTIIRIKSEDPIVR